MKKELQSLLRVYRKSASSAQTDGRIATEGPLYSGQTQGSECFKFTQYYWKGPTLTKEGVFHLDVVCAVCETNIFAFVYIL